jgi:FkbM family methyltransferase
MAGVNSSDSRPFLLRILPPEARIKLWAKFYEKRSPGPAALYHDAPLALAPRMRMDLLPGDVISDSIAFTGIYELALSRTVADRASHGGMFVDVGANLGYFSLLWMGGGSSNRCVAIEASPRNVQLLRQNIKKNGCDDRVKVIAGAAGDATGQRKFDPGPKEQTGWGGLTGDSSSEKSSDAVVEVAVQRIDEIFDLSERIALLKIDVEGADTLVLLGCEKLLEEKRIKEIWYEQNRPRMRALNIKDSLAEKFLKSVDYTVRCAGDPNTEICGYQALPK